MGDFDIKIGVQLSDNGKELRDQWSKIKQQLENDKIKINLDFGKNIQEMLKPILQISNELGNLEKHINNLSNTKKIEIFDSDKTDMKIKNTLRNLEDIQKALRDKGLYSNNNEVKISVKGINEAKNEILSFVTTVKELNGITKEISFVKKTEDSGLVTYNGELTKIIDTTHKVTSELDKFKNEAQKTLNDLNNTGFANKDIFKNIQTEINDLNTSTFKDKMGQINTSLKELEIQAKKTQENFNNIVGFSSEQQGKINNLFSNNIVPKDKVINIEAKISGLQGNESQEYIKSLETEINKLIDEEKLLTQESKNYQNSIKETYNNESKLLDDSYSKEERLKNIKNSYSNKLDNNSDGFNKLENEYNSIIKKINEYKERGIQLTQEEKQGITSRINDYSKEKNNIIEITNEVKKMEQQLNSLQNKYKGNLDTSIIKDKISNFNNTTNFQGDKTDIQKELMQMETLAKEKQRIQGLGTNIGGGLNVGSGYKDIDNYLKQMVSYKANITSVSKVMGDLGERIKTVNFTINEGNGVVSKHKLNIDESTNSIYKMADGLNDISSRHATFTEKLKNSISGLINFTIAGTALFSTLNQLKEGFEFINDLNKTQTNIEMINGMSQGEIKGLTEQYSQLAGQMHSTVQEVMSSAEEYLRAGKTVEESQTMIKNSITMSKISAQSQKEVSEEMIAAMNAFGFTADQMGKQYVDKISALDSASATSSKDISEAVMHTAQSAKLAGVSWDYLLASVTSVMDVTKKSGSEVGNAFRTIFSRMEAIAKGKKDDDGTDINQVEKSLGKVGISLRKNEKEWRSMEDVLKDVQSRWSTFDSVTKSDIASKIGKINNNASYVEKSA